MVVKKFFTPWKFKAPIVLLVHVAFPGAHPIDLAFILQTWRAHSLLLEMPICAVSGLTCLRHLFPCQTWQVWTPVETIRLFWHQATSSPFDVCLREGKCPLVLKPQNNIWLANPLGCDGFLLEWKPPGCCWWSFSWLQSMGSPYHLPSLTIFHFGSNSCRRFFLSLVLSCLFLDYWGFKFQNRECLLEQFPGRIHCFASKLTSKLT